MERERGEGRGQELEQERIQAWIERISKEVSKLMLVVETASEVSTGWKPGHVSQVQY